MSEHISRIPNADDMDDDLFENTEGGDNWKKAAEAIGANFTRLGAALQSLPVYNDDEDDAITSLRDDLQELVQSYGERLDNEGWEDGGSYYIFGQVDTKTLIAAARQEMLDWDKVLNAKALMGTGADIDAIAAAAAEAEQHLDLSDALKWAAEPGSLTEGIYHSGNLESAEALLKHGALPSLNSGHLFFDVLREGREDIARAFARSGKSDSVFYLAYWQENARSFLTEEPARDLLRKMYWEYARYDAIDASTLVERKPLQGNEQLRMIFDFAARRVSEIFTSGEHAFKTEVAFDDYGPAALDIARSKLIELGGNPPPDDLPAGHRALGKPRLSPPAR
ncbi:MAG: hypothetical protein Q8K65_00615 [Alphaproteobacteria bacterium]|nr:hypothetical protein [Alphaproteobacteria bacterium]